MSTPLLPFDAETIVPRRRVWASQALTTKAQQRSEVVRAGLERFLAHHVGYPTVGELTVFLHGPADDKRVFQAERIEVARGMSELRARGVAEIVPHSYRKCRETHVTVATWRLRQR